MSDDIVTRLRESNGMTTSRSDDGFLSIHPDTDLMRLAADEIERLQARYDRLLTHIQLVAQSPDSRLARDILRYYYPLSENGVGTSITLKWIDDEAVRGD